MTIHHHTRAAARLFRSRLRGGYTLIELLVVVTVLGIAGALVIPHMVNRDAMNAQAAVRRIIGDLCFAQSDALSHQEMRQVHFYADGSGYCVVRVTGPSAFSETSSAHDYIIDPLSSAGNSGRYIVNFTTDERFDGCSIADVAIDTNGRDLNYDELGGTVNSSNLPSSGGSLTVVRGQERYRIEVSPFTGKLTVRRLSS